MLERPGNSEADMIVAAVRMELEPVSRLEIA
jgi:hypothetical protein